MFFFLPQKRTKNPVNLIILLNPVLTNYFAICVFVGDNTNKGGNKI